MDNPPGNCSAETGAAPCPDPDSSGNPEGGPCITSQHCAAGTSCVAPFEDGHVGDFTCTSQCIANEDQGAWCLDDTACCEVGAICTSRGLCVTPEGSADDTGTSTGDTGTDGSSGSSDGTTDASSGSEGTTGSTGMG